MRSLAALLIATGSAAWAADAAAPATWASVEPILRTSCIECHGDKKQKGGLRLDTPAGVMAGGKRGAAVAAGKPDDSELLRRVALPDGDDDIMPPKGARLAEAKVATIRAWIAAGAPVPGGAAAPVAKPAPPKSEPPKPPAINAGASNGSATPVAPREPLVLPPTDLDQLAQGLTPADPAAVKRLADGGAWVRPLSTNGALIEVDLSHATSTIKDLLAAAKPVAERIVRLDLAGTAVADADLAVLAGMTRLERLHLERTAIGDAALAHLSHLPALAWLDLYGTKVDDAGIAALAELKKLEDLNVWKTAVTAKGIADLKAKLPELEVMAGEDAAVPTAPREKKKGGKKKN